MLDALKEWLLGLMKMSLTGFDSMLIKASNVLTDGLDNWADIAALSMYLRPFCYIIIAICLLLELAQVAAKVDILKWEHGLKLCVKMVLAKVAIDIAPTFLQACYLQAQAWIVSLANSNSIMGRKTMDSLRPLVENTTGWGNILGLFLSTFIVLMAILICGLIIQVIAYGRIFELYVYLVVSPLPMAFLPLGNGNGDGVHRITTKFLKNFIAVCLQGVMMIIVIRVFDVVIGNTIINALTEAAANTDVNAAVTDLIYTMLLGAIALVMAVIKCGSWAKSIMDAM